MANGIDPQYTGIGRVPIIQERPDTSITDFLQFLSDHKDRQDAKKLEAQKVSDLKEYRQDSLDIQNKELDNLRVHQTALRGIQQQNADTAKTSAEAAATTAELNSKTAYYNSIGDPKRRLIAQMSDPRWKELTGHTNKSIGEEIKAIEDYENDVTLAEGFTTSNNPLHIKYHMQKLKDGDMSGNKAAGETYSNLQKQLKEADEFQKKLYEVTPKEIAEMYPQYAKNLESIAGHFMPQLTMPKNLKGDQMLELMKRQEKHIPVENMEEYNKRVQQVTNAYSNEYRIAKGIGTYEGTKVGEATPFPAETEGRAAFKITPDDYTLTDERFKLIEKAQDEQNDLWERWLNEEDYTFSDLEADYNAGAKEEDLSGDIKQEKIQQEGTKQEEVKEEVKEEVQLGQASDQPMSLSLLPQGQTPSVPPTTFKGKKINLPMWRELYRISKHPVTKEFIPEYDWMDDYAKMLTGNPEATRSDLLTKKGMKHWKKIK